MNIGSKVVNIVNGNILAMAQVVGFLGEDLILRELKGGVAKGPKWVAPPENLKPLAGFDLTQVEDYKVRYWLG